MIGRLCGANALSWEAAREATSAPLPLTCRVQAQHFDPVLFPSPKSRAPVLEERDIFNRPFARFHPRRALLADAIVVACSMAQDIKMEMLGMGRVRARSQHGGEPAAGGLPHRPHEQGLRGIRFMSDGDTSPIFESDCRKIDGDALGMRVRIAARESDRAAATVAASSERDNARAKHRGSKRRHQILRKLRESEGECAIENRVVGMSIVALLAKPIALTRTGWAIAQSSTGAGGAGTISASI